MYKNTSSADTAKNDCQWCNSKDYLNYDNTTSTTTCSNTAIDTKCTATISNCGQTGCFKYSSTVAHTTCYMCDKGYVQSTKNATTNATTACAATTAIGNCEYFSSTDGTTIKCSTCKSDYAVKSDGSQCTSYSTDSNCRQLQSDGKNCHYCWYSYYWNTTTCKLRSALYFLGASAMAVLIAMF